MTCIDNGATTSAIIYAPRAGVQMRGGGPGFFGAIYGNQICNYNGNNNLHYDEALGSTTTGGGVLRLSGWQRCNNATCS